MKVNLIGPTAVVAMLAGGCATAPDGKQSAPPKEVFSHHGPKATATAVSPGVIVSAPVAYGTDGDVAICVKWTAGQATLEGKANWWIDLTHTITSTAVFSTGTYTVHFGACSVSGYTPPPNKVISMPTPNQKVTLTVTYGHL